MPKASRDHVAVVVEFDRADMALRGRIGGYRTHALHDSRQVTAAARQAFLEQFETEVDPDGTLPEEERQRRAQRARKAYFAALALKSARARRKANSATSQGSSTNLDAATK